MDPEQVLDRLTEIATLSGLDPEIERQLATWEHEAIPPITETGAV